MLEKSRLLTCWSRLSLSYRGAVIVTIPALCLLSTLFTWYWSRSAGLELRNRIDRSQAQIAHTKELFAVMVNAETGVRGYLLSGDRDFLEPYRIADRKLPTALANIQQSIGNDPQKLAQLDSIRSQIKSIRSLMVELRTTSIASKQSQLLQQSKREMDALRQVFSAIEKTEQVFLDRQLSSLEELRSLTQALQQLFTAAGILSTVGGIYLFHLLEQELRQREAQIQTRDSKLDTLTTNVIDGVLILDRSGQIETVNPALIEMLGYSSIELQNCPLMRLLVTPSTQQPLPNLLTWLAQQPKLGQVWQLTAHRRDGTGVPIELSLSEIPHESQWIAIVRDVSAQVNSLQQLQTQLEAIEQLNLTLMATNITLNSRNHELAEFAYVTAHDLKTPLRGIGTLAEWIEEEVQNTHSSPQLLQHLQLLRQRTYRLNALIDGLWEYSNLGQTPITPELIEIIPFLKEITSAFPLLAKFKIDVQPQDLQAIVCKPHLRKTIEELLENAVKHTDLDPTSDDRDPIVISVQLVTDRLEFVIRDRGPGIAPEHHQRVFRLFETLKSRDVQENTGIGLAIAKKLVDRVGGKIWLENSPSGKGLSVSFTWPQFP